MKPARCVVVLALLLNGCGLRETANSLGKSFANGALDRARQRVSMPADSPGALKPAIDSLGVFAGNAVTEFVAPTISDPVLMLLDSAELALGRAPRELAGNIEGPINSALTRLLKQQGDSLDARTLRLMLAVRTELLEEVSPLVTHTASEAVNAATGNLARAMEGALLQALTLAADSLARTATNSVSRSLERNASESPLLRNIVIGGVALVLAIFAFALWREKRKDRVMAGEVVERMDPQAVRGIIERLNRTQRFNFGPTELEKALARKQEQLR